MFIKACGLRRKEDILEFLKYPLNALGFIAYEKSPRFVKFTELQALLLLIPPSIKTVAVFVDAEQKFIQDYLDTGIQCIQFHGNEKPEFIKIFQGKAELWKTLKLQSLNDINQVEKFHFIETFIIDSSTHSYGGSGKLADWNLFGQCVKKFPSKRFILAGGIGENNINLAREAFPNLYGLDLSSSLESAPAVKNSLKIKKFFSILEKFSTN